MVYPRTQTQQGESVSEPETLLLILSLVGKSDIKEHRGNLSIPFFKKKVHVQKHHREAGKCRNIIPYINNLILSKYC